MSFNFLNLETGVRDLMLSEVEYDIKNNNLFFSKRLSSVGQSNYVDLLKTAIKECTEESLEHSLNSPGFFNSNETRNTERGSVVANIPTDAPSTLAEGEFNRFYMRAVCRKAIDEKKEVEIYRAKEVSRARSESESKIGKKINPKELLDDLRVNVGVDTSLGLPAGPNSGLSIKIN